jgi:ELWxxDGT repeat protein/cysteine-rich repeat protein
VANAGAPGFEPWRTDGTGSGTGPVKDIFPGLGDSFPSELVAVNGRVLFTADDGANGREVWKSDGTEAGTRLAADILPGPGGGDPQNLVLLNGMILLAADDGVRGVELWAVPVCGDGELDPGEACDDGNREAADCCSTLCQPAAPAGSACENGDLCSEGDTCDGNGTCTPGAARDCDDGAPCTVDTCAPQQGCRTAPVDVAAVRALFTPGLVVAECAGEALPERLPTLFGEAGQSIDRAAAADGPRQRSLLRRAGKQLKRGEKAARRSRQLSRTCRTPVVARFTDARRRARCLLGS